MTLPFWESRAIYVVRAGSHAYGTNLPASDEDTRGVCIPPPEYLIGLKRWQVYRDAEQDRTIYSLHHYVGLAMSNNPQTLEILHVREKDILHITPLGCRLREAAPLFLSKRLGHAASGIANQHVKTLQDRNSSRHGKHRELIDRYGYDVKDAAHVIRTMRLAIEAMATGVVNTYRPDRDELRDILAGGRSFERVLAEVERLHDEIAAALALSTLPDEPNFEAVNTLVMDLHRRALEGFL